MKLLGLIRGTSNTQINHAFHSQEGRLAAQKFDDDEICILEKTWQDLADRSNGKGIDKETFLQYFPLNGLLGERLFAQFDRRKTGYIDFEEFIIGLATACRGTADDKIHFIFNMYDVSHDNTVSKQELSTLLNHIPKQAFTPRFQNGVFASWPIGSPSTPPPGTFPGTTSMSNLQDASDSEKGSIYGDGLPPAEHFIEYEEVDLYTNHEMVERAFAECDLNHEGRLTYEEFKMWIQRNPTIMDYIESILPYAGPRDLSRHTDKKDSLPQCRRLSRAVSAAPTPMGMSTSARHMMGEDAFAFNTGSRRLTRPVENGSMSPSLAGQPISRNQSFSGYHATPGATPGPGSGIAAPGSSAAPSVAEDNEEQVKMHLAAAMELTTSGELKSALLSLLDAMNHPSVLQLPRSPSEIYRAAVSKEGFLWKKGKSLFHTLTKRFCLLSGNCMYYYGRQADLRPKGVVFLTGSIIDRLREPEMEMKGFFGLEITHQDLCTGDHHRHDKRVLYTKSEEEREHWVVALQHAAHVVPIEDDYVIGKELGRGRFSVVCECVNKLTGVHCAVKIIDKATIEPEEKSLLRTEIAVLKLVNHPNIIKMMGLYETKSHIYIVMEMLKGGELFERIVGRPRFTEMEAAKLMRPLLESVAYLHDLGIVHRDLKPENILCGEELEDLKIADFGLSKMILPKEKMDAACGTLSYVAPEVLTMQGYGKEADLWSVGVILFLLLCGKLPFDGDDHNEIIRSTIQADLKVNPTVWSKLTEDAKNLITSLLNKNPKDRITAREALRHPFLLSNLGPPRRQTLVASSNSQLAGSDVAKQNSDSSIQTTSTVNTAH
eukprot:gene7127-7880_t